MLKSQFIGTYSFVQPYPDTSSTNTISIELESASQDTEDHVTTSDDVVPVEQHHETANISPGSHIYHTLDKYIEELESILEDTSIASNKDMYDRLFDDPNYSPIRTSDVSSLFSPVIVPRTSKVVIQYDKLASKPTDGDYAYAYSHLASKNKKHHKSRSLQDKDIFHIAAMGTYEMDPEFLSNIRSQTQPPIKSIPPPNKVKNEKHTKACEKSTAVNCYQPIDHSTLTPDHSYTLLTKNIIQ